MYVLSHDVSIYYMMELWTSLQVSILHPKHHSSWTGLPFLLGYLFIARRFFINDVTAFVIFILHLELSSLVLWNKFYPSLLVGNFLQVKYICMARKFWIRGSSRVEIFIFLINWGIFFESWNLYLQLLPSSFLLLWVEILLLPRVYRK